MPGWITALSTAVADDAVWQLSDILGDGDDYFVHVTLSEGTDLLALVYVDHNLGTVVKDAFASPGDHSRMREILADTITADQTLAKVDPAQARADIERAIELGASTFPPLESDKWPLCRPLIEWMVRLLPEGGTARDVREWAREELDAIIADFLASPFGGAHDNPEDRATLDSILWFASSYTDGDPYRWSPVNVEILLASWYPNKVIDRSEYLARMPQVLRPFIRFCHHTRGIPAARTQETLASVDRWEPTFQELIHGDRPHGLAGYLAGLLDDNLLDEYEDEYDDEYEDVSRSEFYLRRLDRQVGGRDALNALTDVPLPDEEFDWSGIPTDIHPLVAEYLAACDRVAGELLNVEYRTAMRRLLSRVAAGDPTIFRRKAAANRGAAAIAWMVVRVNEHRVSSVGDLLQAFGVTGSVSQRAEPMQRAIGIDPYRQYSGFTLGSVDYLVSETRASFIRSRTWASNLDD